MRCSICNTVITEKNNGNIHQVFPDLFTPSELERIREKSRSENICVVCKKAILQASIASVVL